MGPRLFRRVNVDRFPTSNYRYSFPAHFSVASILLFECRESIYRAAGNFTCVARPDPWNWTVWFRSKRWTTTAFMRKCAVLEAPGILRMKDRARLTSFATEDVGHSYVTRYRWCKINTNVFMWLLAERNPLVKKITYE